MLISLSNLNRIKAHARATFPEECCGLLIGNVQREHANQQTIVQYIAPCLNQLRGDRTQGFEIDALRRYEIEMTAKEYGMNVVGTYHSHTRCGAFPSATDCDEMPSLQTMLIVFVNKGIVEEVRAFCKTINSEIFEEQIRFLF